MSKVHVRRILAMLLCTAAMLSSGSDGDGALTGDIIERIQASHTADEKDRIIANALTKNKITDIVLNRDFFIRHNDLFSHTIDTKGITDQKSSGRCWLFAAFNVLRPAMIKTYKLKNFEFSQNYLFFWDKMEKANTFLERIIETADTDLTDREMHMLLRSPIGDGGYWAYVVNLVNKYGVIPKDAMPETYSSEHSWPMNDLLARRLRMDAYELRSALENGVTIEDVRKVKIEMLEDVYRMLAFNLGEPPSEFIWRYETVGGKVSEAELHTPYSFYTEVVKVNLSAYIPLMHYPGKEYNRLYQFDDQRNVWEAPDPLFINADIPDIKTWAKTSVLSDDPAYFYCDVVPDKYSKAGILSTRILDYRLMYDIPLDMPKAERILYRESASNHAMVLIGVDIENDDPVKWLTEDSHGPEDGHDGYWTLYDDWFDAYVYGAVIHEDHVPAAIRRLMQEKPIHLPYWDPMAQLLWDTE
ncbi:MAG: C1 family peptidase [candidate division WOR-3 bacterium]|nr:MAG: C1 family peptidase [candidate division WOR-3 bacterium]